MKPYIHAKNSVKKWGGIPEDYMEIHDFIDSTKAHIGDMRHRALLHNTFGCYIVEKVFGQILVKPDGSAVKTSYITNSDGVKVQVRDIAEQHIIDDLGFIPSVQDYLQHMESKAWFSMPNYMARIKKEIEDKRND